MRTAYPPLTTTGLVGTPLGGWWLDRALVKLRVKEGLIDPTAAAAARIASDPSSEGAPSSSASSEPASAPDSAEGGGSAPPSPGAFTALRGDSPTGTSASAPSLRPTGNAASFAPISAAVPPEADFGVGLDLEYARVLADGTTPTTAAAAVAAATDASSSYAHDSAAAVLPRSPRGVGVVGRSTSYGTGGGDQISSYGTIGSVQPSDVPPHSPSSLAETAAADAAECSVQLRVTLHHATLLCAVGTAIVFAAAGLSASGGQSGMALFFVLLTVGCASLFANTAAVNLAVMAAAPGGRRARPFAIGLGTLMIHALGE